MASKTVKQITIALVNQRPRIVVDDKTGRTKLVASTGKTLLGDLENIRIIKVKR